MDENSLVVTVCVPVYNGAKTIGALVEEIIKELSPHYKVEIVLVNDSSRDNSDEVCKQLARNHVFVKYISLRKNFGEHNAVMCALNYATGDYVVIVDDDFQNPPHEIRALVEEARKGYDVVYSAFHEKQHDKYRNIGSRFNDWVATRLLEKPANLYLSSFKAINADMVKRIIRYKGPSPYIDGLILRETRNISSVRVQHDARREGQSNYTLTRLLALWLNMFVNFSVMPLRLFSMFGVFVILVSFVAAIIFIIQKLFDPGSEMGWTSVMVSILFFSGVQIVFLGLIIEYIGKNYFQTNGTPQWVVKEEYL
jgi:undecaprenyl-phosphate 4-deoxy-4-formamido-L-arabinose transferase